MNRCPCYGYCPHCGRSDRQAAPVPVSPWYYPVYPVQPSPIWISPTYVGPPWERTTITCTSGVQ